MTDTPNKIVSIAEMVGDTRVAQPACIMCGEKFICRRTVILRTTCYKCMPKWTSLRRRAQNAVRKAVREGRLPDWRHLACVDCGRPSIGYEHRDYSKKLDVVPICVSCNYKRGPAKIGKSA